MMRSALILAVVALAAVARAEVEEETMTQLGLETSDDQEKAALSGNLLAFGDFCIQSRDHIAHDIKNNANDFSARVFSFFFDSGEVMGRDALEVAKIGTERLGAQLANPNAEIAAPTSEIEKIYAEGQERIKNVQSQPSALLEAFKTSVGAISQNVRSSVTQGLETLRKMASIEELVKALKKGCEKVSEYEKDLKAQFEDYKQTVAAKSEALAAYTFADIPCATSRKVSQAEGLCTFVNVAKGPLEKLYRTRN